MWRDFVFPEELHCKGLLLNSRWRVVLSQAIQFEERAWERARWRGPCFEQNLAQPLEETVLCVYVCECRYLLWACPLGWNYQKMLNHNNVRHSWSAHALEPGNEATSNCDLISSQSESNNIQCYKRSCLCGGSGHRTALSEPFPTTFTPLSSQRK